MHAGERTLVVGAGIGGISAALSLAANGNDVLVLERQPVEGGKARNLNVGGLPVAAGPTVLTMRWVFDALFAKAGRSLDDAVRLTQAHLLARHGWRDGARLDLHSDIDASAEAIGVFGGRANAKGYRRFCADSRAMFEILRDTYINAQRPGPFDLVSRIGVLDPRRQLALRPLSTMWSALGGYFTDPRLCQLFGRYATYCGSSPFAAPATLMLVAHVEQDGVWTLDGGIHGLAREMRSAAQDMGASFRFDSDVTAIMTDASGVCGVRLASGETVAGRNVVFNGDISALAPLTGSRSSCGIDPVRPSHRSLSALTWCVRARTSGFPLAHHSVFFSPDYREEFETILTRRSFPREPTVYVCAQDRDDRGQLLRTHRDGRERMLFIINAAADGDARQHTESELETCLETTLTYLRRCGLEIDRSTMDAAATSPAGFNSLFPHTGGALYGRASHGWMASFQRPGAKTAIPGLYLAGGSAHPGPGVPMAAISGMLAAECLERDRASTPRFRRAAISGGMSTASATVGSTG